MFHFWSNAGAHYHDFMILVLSSFRYFTGTDGTTDSAEIRLALCTSAKRKACALFSYRSTIIRWTSKPTSNIRVQQRCERFASREKCNSCHSSGESDSSEFLRGDLLRLAWGETQGRFLAADMAIPAGTVLIKERPFSWCIEPPYATDFCGHCLCEVRTAYIWIW